MTHWRAYPTRDGFVVAPEISENGVVHFVSLPREHDGIKHGIGARDLARMLRATADYIDEHCPGDDQ